MIAFQTVSADQTVTNNQTAHSNRAHAQDFDDNNNATAHTPSPVAVFGPGTWVTVVRGHRLHSSVRVGGSGATGDTDRRVSSPGVQFTDAVLAEA